MYYLCKIRFCKSLFFNTFVAVSFSFCIAVLARAETECNPLIDSCNEVGSWKFSLGIGLGVRTNPLVDSNDIPLILIPEISYTGEHFFIQNLDAGMFILEHEQQQFNAIVTPSYDPIYFYNNHPSNYFIGNNGVAITDNKNTPDITSPSVNTNSSDGTNVNGNSTDGTKTEGKTPTRTPISWRELHPRRTAGLAGFEYHLTSEFIALQLQLLHDVTNIHGGDEARLTLEKDWQSNKHRLSFTLGANWQSREVIQYYYGVGESEADATGRYNAPSGISTLVRFDWNYKLTQHWELHFLAAHRHLPNAISASPIVQENKVVTAFVGGVYHF